jgi:hypothetical protein
MSIIRVLAVAAAVFFSVAVVVSSSEPVNARPPTGCYAKGVTC